MPSTAYDLRRFEARPKAAPPPHLKVAKAPAKKRRRQLASLLKTLAICALLVLLVSAVLRTQAVMTELHKDIARAEKQLSEEEGLNTYLTGELNSMVNLRNIEERAGELGLVKLDPGKVTYIRVEESNSIEARPGTVESLLGSLKAGILSLLGIEA